MKLKIYLYYLGTYTHKQPASPGCLGSCITKTEDTGWLMATYENMLILILAETKLYVTNCQRAGSVAVKCE